MRKTRWDQGASRISVLLGAFFVTFVVSAAPVSAQPPAYASAEEHFAEGRFEEARDAYREALAEDPAHGMSWFRLGMALHELGSWDEAAAAYEEAVGLGTQVPSARLRLARVRSRAGDLDAALDALEVLASSGFGATAALTGQPDLEPLHSRERWTAVLAGVQANSQPCLHQEEPRQFDFWVGEWDVFSPQGTQLGENRVESVLEGCALMENWTNVGGRSGKSLNVYDSSSGTPAWRQLYVGDFGGVTDYRDGRWEDGVMHFQARVLRAQGDTVIRHMRFRPVGADTVHQVIEDVDAQGGVTTQFNGVYVRKRGR